jgi:hypothetical protein
VTLAYAYAQADSVTVSCPSHSRGGFLALIEWAVPGLRGNHQRVAPALPKSIRRELMPFPPKVPDIVRDFRPQRRSCKTAAFLHRRYGVPEGGDWRQCLARALAPAHRSLTPKGNRGTGATSRSSSSS